MACGLENVQALYSLHTRPLIDRLQKGYLHWTQHSVERIIFDTLLLESGVLLILKFSRLKLLGSEMSGIQETFSIKNSLQWILNQTSASGIDKKKVLML